MTKYYNETTTNRKNAQNSAKCRTQQNTKKSKMKDTTKTKKSKNIIQNTSQFNKTKYNNKYRTPLSPSTDVADPGLAGVAKRLQ